MKAEIVRKIDELGRIVLPTEMQNSLGWDNEENISINQQGEQMVLQTYQGSCFVCGSEENIQNIHGKFICKKCISELI